MTEETTEPLVLLLVEDNDAHAEMVMRSFSQHDVGSRIIHLSDGQKALDYVFRNGEYVDTREYPRPHCILLDLRLPRVDGIEVLRRIKSDEATRKIPVVVMTTSSADKDVSRAYEYNANSYVVKPMDFDRFETLMRDLGFYWLTWNQIPGR